MPKALQYSPHRKHVTHVFANLGDRDISVDSLGLNPSQHGGHYLEDERIEYDNDRSPVVRSYNKHVIGPGEALVTSLLSDIRAIAPQLTDLGPADICSSRTTSGWDMLPLSHLERWLFIDKSQIPSELLDLTYRELVKMGFA